MLITDILARKRDAAELSADEIRFLIDGFVRDEVSDYQMASFAMAVCIRGMTARETADLTMAMLQSGDQLERTGAARRVDKHSTGGLGDKVSLVLAPLLAACDVCVPMISGRGLGLTGGTLDKLESIPQFCTSLGRDRADQLLDQVGAFIIGADERIAPADRKLYALRDVTATVPSVALITASILSKKLAASLDGLVMDVKVGSGAMMQDHDSAIALASSLIDTGAHAGLNVTALITDMDQPLGSAVGNAIEVNEAIEVLDGAAGPVRDLTIALATEALSMACQTPANEAKDRATAAIESGRAMERFRRMVAQQGGRLDGALPVHPPRIISSPHAGYVGSIDCPSIGRAVVACGGGRQKVTDTIDPAAGVTSHVRIGDRVEKGQALLSLHAVGSASEEYARQLATAVQIAPSPVAPRPLILQTIR